MVDLDISAILLAAGFSRRMGDTDKLLLEYGGKTLIERAVCLLDSLPCRQKILVVGPGLFETLALPPGVEAVINHNPQAGQSESLRLGLGSAIRRGYIFLNADQPRLSLGALRPLFALAAENADKIAYPTIDGLPCSPAFFSARFRAELLSQTGDAGGRAVRAAHPESRVTFEAENPLDFMDVDSPEDYRELTSHPHEK